VLYLERPHAQFEFECALGGRFGYSDLKEAAPRGSLWVLYVVEQVGMICKVAVGDCARPLQREIDALRWLAEAGEKAGRTF